MAKPVGELSRSALEPGTSDFPATVIPAEFQRNIGSVATTKRK